MQRRVSYPFFIQPSRVYKHVFSFYDASPDPEQNPGRVCKPLVNECTENKHNCSPNAKCEDKLDGYLLHLFTYSFTCFSFSCSCNKNFVDTSSNYGLNTGRVCSISTNECADRRLNTCDEKLVSFVRVFRVV